jgi:serine protease Do
MRTLRFWLCRFVSVFWLALAAAHAASAQPVAVQEMMEALARAHAAVVGVRVMVDEEARSAETLGQLRSGSGVVIAPDGLILTIGYLMLEAEQIEIVTQDNKTLPARAVAYDQATGFGLLRPLLPLRGVSAVTLGRSAELQPGEVLMAVTGPQTGSSDNNNSEGGVSMTRLVSQRAFSGNG